MLVKEGNFVQIPMILSHSIILTYLGLKHFLY